MILQQSIQIFILWRWSILINFFNDYLLGLALEHAKSNLLVKLSRLLDVAPIDYHLSAGPGSPATHSAKKMARAMLVKYIYDLSLREMEERLYSDMIMRWFVGYSLFDSLPDHSTLERFELWLKEHQRFAIFDEIMRQIRQDFPEETRMTQIGDTYAMRANAAKEDLRPMIRHVCSNILETAIDTFPRQIDRTLLGFDWRQLLGMSPETSLPSKEDQAERLQRVVLAALELQRRISSLLDGHTEQDFPTLRKHLAALTKSSATKSPSTIKPFSACRPKSRAVFGLVLPLISMPAIASTTPTPKTPASATTSKWRSPKPASSMKPKPIPARSPTKQVSPL